MRPPTLDARHFTRGDLDDLRVKAAFLTPAQVHAQQHLRPVLRLGAAGTRLYVQEGVGLIHLAGKHAVELQFLQLPFQLVQVAVHRGQRVRVLLFPGHIEQALGVLDAGAQAPHGLHHLLQRGPLTAQRLRPFGIFPDVGDFQFAVDFGQAFGLAIVFKDTSSGILCVP